jgi:hypothetical protein
MLKPVEQGQVSYRALKGLPPKHHAHLKYRSRLLAVLQGDTSKEANDRAERLACALNLDYYSIEAT